MSVEVLSGHLAPKLLISIPHLRLALDPLQLTVLNDLLEALMFVIKRSTHLYHLKGIFTELDPPPRVNHEEEMKKKKRGAIHILPQLLIGRNGLQFPGDISLTTVNDEREGGGGGGGGGRGGGGGGGIVGILKKRCHDDVEMGSWAKHMWRYTIEMIINDLRPHLPYGRWKNLILLCWSRKEYAFLYSKYLRVSSTTDAIVASSLLSLCLPPSVSLSLCLSASSFTLSLPHLLSIKKSLR
jgi:hypothetical protein